ncbi:hypothetical protein [Treponema paraluiscuniculi]|uniref:hypothetical protein n=1 Tax=Treponema paraluiscuniculi TaxID=53435 RepID=UPI002FDBAD9F
MSQNLLEQRVHSTHANAFTLFMEGRGPASSCDATAHALRGICMERRAGLGRANRAKKRRFISRELTL